METRFRNHPCDEYSLQAVAFGKLWRQARRKYCEQHLGEKHHSIACAAEAVSLRTGEDGTGSRERHQGQALHQASPVDETGFSFRCCWRGVHRAL